MTPLIALAILLTFPTPQQSMKTVPPTSSAVTMDSLEPTASLPCFFQTSWNVFTQSYVGNGTTHDSKVNNIAAAPYNKTGSNYFIFDGPLFYVGTACQANKISFAVSNVDPLVNHFICQNPNPSLSSNTSCTSVTTCAPGVTACGDQTECTGGETCSSAIPNTYDLGLYCVGGPCTFGQLYAETGPLNVAQFFQSGTTPYRVDLTLHFGGGGTTLPVGEYAIGMATNCDAGNGGGGGDCGLGKGEGGGDGYNGGADSSVVKAGTQLLSFKYFTGGSNPSKCLLYDPLHENSIGLPPMLASYATSGCTAIHTNSVEPKVFQQAPHVLNYVIWNQ